MFFEFLEEGAKFAAGAHGGDTDAGGFPIEEVADFVDGLFLQIEKADDDGLAWVEVGEEFVEELAGKAGGAFDGL